MMTDRYNDINFDDPNLDEDGSDIDENFEVQLTDEMDLFASWEMARNSLYMFFNDQPNEVMNKMKSTYKTSMYHALGYAGTSFLTAFLSLNKKEIERASEAVKQCLQVVKKYRHKDSLTTNLLTKILMRPNYNNYTDAEVHAEICYADCLIMRALLIIFHDGNLMSYLNGGLKIRRSYQAYKECKDILEHRTIWKNQFLKDEFESGVDIGLGEFNMIVASLPSRLLKFLQFIGFSGDRVLAFQRLNSGVKKTNTIRGPLCSIMLLLTTEFTNYILSSPLERSPKVLVRCDQMIGPLAEKCPKGAFVDYFKGKLDYIGGNFIEAIEAFEKVASGHKDPFQHFAIFDLCWIYTSQGEWRKAAHYFDYLSRENSWSKALYYYMKACTLMMCNDVTNDERLQIFNCMNKVPQHVQRFLGKSFPVDKYCFRRTERFFAQNNWLPLPVYELMYGIGYFYFLKGQKGILESIMIEIDRTIIDLKEGDHKDIAWQTDSYYLAVFLKGLCLEYLGFPLSAEEYFLEILENQKNIVKDTHIVAFALIELSYISRLAANYQQALEYLLAAKPYSIFFTDFRIHEGLTSLKRKLLVDTETGSGIELNEELQLNTLLI